MGSNPTLDMSEWCFIFTFPSLPCTSYSGLKWDSYEVASDHYVLFVKEEQDLENIETSDH